MSADTKLVPHVMPRTWIEENLFDDEKVRLAVGFVEQSTDGTDAKPCDDAVIILYSDGTVTVEGFDEVPLALFLAAMNLFELEATLKAAN